MFRLFALSVIFTQIAWIANSVAMESQDASKLLTRGTKVQFVSSVNFKVNRSSHAQVIRIKFPAVFTNYWMVKSQCYLETQLDPDAALNIDAESTFEVSWIDPHTMLIADGESEVTARCSWTTPLRCGLHCGPDSAYSYKEVTRELISQWLPVKTIEESF